MVKTETDHTMQANLSGFYQFLKGRHRFPEGRIAGIIACTGAILNRVHDLTMSRSDLERIRKYIRGIGLSGETINFYLTSFVLYVTYLENARGTG
jgi:hypothetical protein